MDSSLNSSIQSSIKLEDIISTRALEVFTYIDFNVLYCIISLSGIIANILNIHIFAKMDLKDTVNICLLALAFSDLCYLVLTLLMSISYFPCWNSSVQRFDVADLRYLVIGWPHFYFKRVSNWITAYLMFERCLCIALPLKIHEIITPKRTTAVILAIFVIMAVAVCPVYVSASYKLRFDSTVNKTLLVLVFTSKRGLLSSITTGISCTLTAVTFIWFISCTYIMVSSLKGSNKWRAKSSSGDICEAKFSRDQKVIKMVTLLSIIFIVAFLPEGAVLLAQTIDQRITFGGQYRNFLLVILGISETILSINASLNIVVYWKMSSKFREIFGIYACKLGQGK